MAVDMGHRLSGQSPILHGNVQGIPVRHALHHPPHLLHGQKEVRDFPGVSVREWDWDLLGGEVSQTRHHAEGADEDVVGQQRLVVHQGKRPLCQVEDLLVHRDLAKANHSSRDVARIGGRRMMHI